MPVITRFGRWIVLGLVFFCLGNTRHALIPCHGFLLPSHPAEAPRRRQHLKAPPTSLSLMHPAVDLLLAQSATNDASYYVVHSAIDATNLLLGTDATLHHMANVMDPETTSQLLALPDSLADVVPEAAASASSTAPGALSPTTTVLVFAAGLIPFAVATVEFWRRVALRLPFGTGSKDDSVLIVIGDDNDRQLSRGRRVLGKDALVVAIVLFGVAASVIGIVVASVLTSTPPPPGAY